MDALYDPNAPEVSLFIERDVEVSLNLDRDKSGVVGPQGPTGATGPAGATGATGPQGPQGLAGNNVLGGNGVPTSGVGNNGDYYLNLDNMDLYGPKASGAWGSAFSLVGPQGPQGIQGIQGIQGFREYRVFKGFKDLRV
jgi:hypothetical protein